MKRHENGNKKEINASDAFSIFKDKSVCTSLSILQETVNFDIPDGVPKSVSFVESLNEIRKGHQALITSQKQKEMLDFVKSQAESLVAGNPTEGNSTGQELGGEMTREKEREQEQEQQRQQQQQAQISYGNPRAVVIPWSLNLLKQNKHGEEAGGPFYNLNTFSPRPDSVKYSIPGTNEKRVVPGVKPLEYPKEMFLSSNYLDKTVDKSQLIRIRNVSVVLEWVVGGKSKYVALTLNEAQSIRRFLHDRSSATTGAIPPLALHGLEADRRIDSTPNFSTNNQNVGAKQNIVAFHFWDNKMFFEEDEIKLLLQTFKTQPKETRRSLFDATLLSRRRDRTSWVGTPVAQV